MTDRNFAHVPHRVEEADGRRRQLRAMLLSAADAARQGRRVHDFARRLARPVGHAVRDRVSKLFSAVG